MKSVLSCHGDQKSRDFWKTKLAKALLMGLGVFSVVGFAQTALALPPTYSVIGPREFNIPVTKPRKGVSAFFQNFVYNNDDKVYDSGGNKVDAAQQTHSFLGVTRIGHVFSLPFTPKVGYYWEWLQPEVHITDIGGARSSSITGLADPLFILAAYFHPTKNSVLGYDNGFTVPVGNSNLSFNYWSFQPNIFFDYALGQGIYGTIGIDGLAGATIKTNSNNNGNEIENGNDYYADVRLRYQPNKWLVPFASYDYIHTDKSTFDSVNGQTITTSSGGSFVPVQGDTAVGKSHEHIVGGGMEVFFNPAQTFYLSVSYKIGIDGRNRGRTNGVFSVFKYLF